jgi:hypothetical protein
VVQNRTRIIKIPVVIAKLLHPSSVIMGWEPSRDRQDAPDFSVKASNVNRCDCPYADVGDDADGVNRFFCETLKAEKVTKPIVHRSNGGINLTIDCRFTDEYPESSDPI